MRYPQGQRISIPTFMLMNLHSVKAVYPSVGLIIFFFCNLVYSYYFFVLAEAVRTAFFFFEVVVLAVAEAALRFGP